ncbi:MAG: isocitrate/isopropylmalate dehydrogenase family protein [Rhodospirillales bacterium]|nr:isocitrate/isopropylmalate dehydrogenase family protein [Rhodospirillales bacterium]
MTNQRTFRIAVLPGDGIGSEVMAACLRVLDALSPSLDGIELATETLKAGAELYRRSGEAFPEAAFERARQADAILLGAMGLPDVRGPDGREMAPQLDLRERLQLFAGVRPIRTLPGLALPLADPRASRLDLVLVRESTEGLFAGRAGGRIEGDETARDTLTITRSASERLFDFAFELARRRKAASRPGRVTCVDKANVLRSFGFFRGIFDERARLFPDIQAEHCYVDAMALNLVRQPWSYDVIVTENMFGDILSDLGAGLMGGMGMAPSADIGESHAVFQPCHGSAPDIAGQGKANPTAMLLSAAMMLEWLGDKHDVAACGRTGRRLTAAVTAAFAEGSLRPFELGGQDGTAEITEAVLRALEQTP